MIEEVLRRCGRRLRGRPLVAGTAVLVSAASLSACGDASDEATNTNAAASAQTAKAPATQASSKPKALEKRQTAKGTVPVGALRFGYNGKIVVTPNGDTPGPATTHWYKPGTHVVIRAVNTKLGRFTEWTGLCQGQRRKVCKLVVPRKGGDVFAGFNTPPGVKKTDPGVKFTLND